MTRWCPAVPHEQLTSCDCTPAQQVDVEIKYEDLDDLDAVDEDEDVVRTQPYTLGLALQRLIF